MMMLWGVIANIAVAAAFTPGQARELFRFVGTALGWMTSDPALLQISE